MQLTMPLEGADPIIRDLLLRLHPGDDLVFTRNSTPVAKLVSEEAELPPSQQLRVPGLGKGFITIVQDDDEHLEHFAEYMP